MSETIYAGTYPDTGATSRGAPMRDTYRHVYWGSIFLGLAIAVALQILLGLLGLAIGFSAFDPRSPDGFGGLGVGSAVYIVITQIVSLFVGAYIAARMNPTVTTQSAVFHGSAIWALTTILAFWLATTSVGAVVSGLSGAISNLGQAAGQAMEAALPDDLTLDPRDLSFENLPPQVQDALRQRGITPENFRQELADAYRQVVSPEEQRRIVQELQQTASEILRNPADAPEDIRQALDKIFGGPNSILSQEDIGQIERVLQNRLNLSDQELEEIGNALERTFADARQGLERTVQAARQQAIDAADEAADRIAAVAFWSFVASLLGLLAAIGGAWLGESNKRKERRAI